MCTIYGVKSGLYVLLQEQSITSWYCVKECCYVFGLFGESDASPALTIKNIFHGVPLKSLVQYMIYSFEQHGVKLVYDCLSIN